MWKKRFCQVYLAAIILFTTIILITFPSQIYIGDVLSWFIPILFTVVIFALTGKNIKQRWMGYCCFLVTALMVLLFVESSLAPWVYILSIVLLLFSATALLNRA